MPVNKVYKKEISSDPDNLPLLEEFIINVAKEINLSVEKLNNLTLSVSEAASNGILHGNKLDRNKKLKVKVEINSSKMTVSIKDEGNGFNPVIVPDPTRPENIFKESGRGIHIMKSFLDELKYNFTATGTETILVLSID